MAVDIMPGQISLFDLPQEPVELTETVKELKPLTLEQIGGLDMCRSEVWIETKARFEVDSTDALCRFLLLFPALFISIGIPIGSERRHYQFKYHYNGQPYWYNRIDEFYGREWRVWPDKPTEEQREAAKWE